MYHVCELKGDLEKPIFVAPDLVATVSPNGVEPDTKSVIRMRGERGISDTTFFVCGDTRQVDVALRVAAAELAQYERLQKALKRLASSKPLVSTGKPDPETRARTMFAEQVYRGANPADIDLEQLAAAAMRRVP